MWLVECLPFSKVLAIVSNYFVWFFLRNVQVDSKTEQGINVTFDRGLPLWQSLEGRFAIFFMECSPVQKMMLQNLMLVPFNVFVILLFFLNEYKKAVRFGLPTFDFPQNTFSYSRRLIFLCFIWLIVYLLLYAFGFFLL